MAYRFQFRGDEEANWTGVILADREIGILIKNGKNTNLYKIGDGKKPWEDLPYYGFDGTISTNLEIVANEQANLSVLSKLVTVNKFIEIDNKTVAIDNKLTSIDTNIENIEKAIGDPGDNKDIYTELSTIKGTIGTQEEGEENIYTQLSTIKGVIGTKGDDNKDIYTELSDINTELNSMLPSLVVSTNTWDGELNKGEQARENVLYFVYE